MGRNVGVTAGTTVCSFGAGPSTLVASLPTVLAEGRPVGRITDIAPYANIVAFPLCMSLGNPAVAAATAAAFGVLVPQPCTPAVPAPWVNGTVTTLVAGVPALAQGATCQCVFGGTIVLSMPGALRTQVS